MILRQSCRDSALYEFADVAYSFVNQPISLRFPFLSHRHGAAAKLQVRPEHLSAVWKILNQLKGMAIGLSHYVRPFATSISVALGVNTDQSPVVA